MPADTCLPAVAAIVFGIFPRRRHHPLVLLRRLLLLCRPVARLVWYPKKKKKGRVGREVEEDHVLDRIATCDRVEWLSLYTSATPTNYQVVLRVIPRNKMRATPWAARKLLISLNWFTIFDSIAL